MSIEKYNPSPEANLEMQLNNPRISVDKIKKHNGENFAFIKVDKMEFPLPIYLQDEKDFSYRINLLVIEIDYALSIPRQVKNGTEIFDKINHLADKIMKPFSVDNSFQNGKAAVVYSGFGIIKGDTLLEIIADPQNPQIENSIRELTGTIINKGIFAGSPPKLSERMKDFLNARFEMED